MDQQRETRGKEKWAALVVPCLITAGLSGILGWASAQTKQSFSASSQLSNMSNQMASLQKQVTDLAGDLKQAQFDNNNRFVSQDQFREFIKAYDRNHDEALRARESMDRKLDDIMDRLPKQRR